MTTAFETIASGLAFPEGPIFMPDGSIVIVELAGGANPGGNRSLFRVGVGIATIS